MVEIILEIEDEFQIAIADKDMESLYTPNDLAGYIFVHFHTAKKEKCSSQVAFYRLRKLFIDNFNYTREELTVKTNLQTLLGKDIRSKWKKLNTLLDDKIYDKTLYLKKEENIIFNSISLVILLGIYLFSQAFWGSLFSVLILMAISHFYLTQYFGTELAKRYTELSSLIHYVDENRLELYDSKKRILERVLAISADVLNIPVSEISPNALYVDDLGAG